MKSEKVWVKYYPENVPPEIELPRESIVETFDRMAEKFSDRTAVVFYGSKIKYKTIKEHSDRFAAALRSLGVESGDRVAMYLPNTPQFIIAYLGILKRGATVTPISPVYSPPEVKYQIEDSGAKIIVTLDSLFENIQKADVELEGIIVTNVGEYLSPLKKFLGKSLLSKVLPKEIEIPTVNLPRDENIHHFQDLIKRNPPIPPERIDLESLASLSYTGGTTGLPKGVMLTHFNLAANLRQTIAAMPFIEEGKEVIVAFLPFYHIYGQVVIMLLGLVTGSTLLLFTTFDPDNVLYSIKRYNATIFFGVPTVFEILNDFEKTLYTDWKQFKMIMCGADILHESTYDTWVERTGAEIHEGYGLTETSPLVCLTPYGRYKKGFFGIPIPSVDVRVIDPETEKPLPPGEIGELIVHGPNVMKGYWNKPEETEKAFLEMDGKKWLRTGDLVKMDGEGYIAMYDRKKDLIKYKGYSIFAREVEEILRNHPAVDEAAVIGIPHKKYGQIVKAVVVLESEYRGKVSENDILEYCKENLAPYKVPSIIEFRGEIPKTDVGKVSREELRKLEEEVYG